MPGSTLYAHKAYIEATSGPIAYYFDDATGIGLMEEGRSQMEDGAIYKQGSTIVNLAGQMVNGQSSNLKLPQGIYIQNGKKILIPYKP